MNLIIRILIPFIAALLYHSGGTVQWKWCPLGQKWWRWGMGLPLSILSYFFINHSYWVFLLIPLYYIATGVFTYGEKSWLNFLGETAKFVVCGMVFGLASAPALGILAAFQMFIASVGFLIARFLDEKNIIKQPWTELLRGFMGTICYL